LLDYTVNTTSLIIVSRYVLETYLFTFQQGNIVLATSREI
jgi:hypothetical protein